MLPTVFQGARDARASTIEKCSEREFWNLSGKDATCIATFGNRKYRRYPRIQGIVPASTTSQTLEGWSPREALRSIQNSKLYRYTARLRSLILSFELFNKQVSNNQRRFVRSALTSGGLMKNHAFLPTYLMRGYWNS